MDNNTNKKILVLVENYPDNNGNVSLMYVHTRNLYYVENGLEVTVLSFKTSENYCFQGIPVISLGSYKKKYDEYDLLVVHAANLKHHYLFLKKYQNRFKHILFFYHGHEVLKINKVYSKPYGFIKNNCFKMHLQNVYDDFKLIVWRYYLMKIYKKSFFVFVSNWMRDEFFKWTKISRQAIENRTSVTYNCVGKKFETEKFDSTNEKEYDFITIRNNLDDSKYSIDIVNDWAKNTPNGKFLLVGQGEFFQHVDKSNNITWLNQTMSHDEIIKALDKCRFALMPTRTDAQGLMMCEMAAYGIPVITSDIPVCHEIFGGFENAFFIKNIMGQTLNEFLSLEPHCIKDKRFYKKVTLDNELEIIYSIMKE